MGLLNREISLWATTTELLSTAPCVSLLGLFEDYHTCNNKGVVVVAVLFTFPWKG